MFITKKKMKKIYSILTILLICSVICVSAVLIEHYGVFQTNIKVTQPISVEGNLVNDISLIAGTGIFGDKITISNSADWDIKVQIVSDNNELEIPVRYCRSTNVMGFPIDCFDYLSNDIILTLNNESIEIYPHYFASPLLESGTYTITTQVNPII